MAKTKEQKEQAVQDLVERIKDAKSVVFANFQGLTVSESEELRGLCREEGVGYIATKKTLLKKALSDVGMDIDTKAFEGGVATVFGVKDEVAPAQIIAKFAKEHDVVSMFGGVLEGEYMERAEVEELSKLPSRQELLGKFVGTINAPVSGFVNVLSGNMRGLLNVLNSIKESKA